MCLGLMLNGNLAMTVMEYDGYWWGMKRFKDPLPEEIEKDTCVRPLFYTNIPYNVRRSDKDDYLVYWQKPSEQTITISSDLAVISSDPKYKPIIHQITSHRMPIGEMGIHVSYYDADVCEKALIYGEWEPVGFQREDIIVAGNFDIVVRRFVLPKKREHREKIEGLLRKVFNIRRGK